ncbi:MAG: hypothetical protein JWQ27_2671 [Ferruginibacter sp.]|nr:hypothetical protein [Ferruginibacter sp.]
MTNKNDILRELAGLSPHLAAIPRVNVYRVPEGYFSQLPVELQRRVQEESSFELPAGNHFSVPEGYFDQLAGNIMNRIKAETSQLSEIATLSPTLAAIGNQHPFTVPAGYFDGLAKEIRQQLPVTAKVVQMKPRSNVFRYAAAAVVSGVIGLSVLSVFNNRTEQPALPAPDNTAVMAKAGEILRSNSFEKELLTVSDKDIEQYLVKHGQDVNAALVASATDDNNLPDPTDYLTNENTLDEFLNQINVTN